MPLVRLLARVAAAEAVSGATAATDPVDLSPAPTKDSDDGDA